MGYLFSRTQATFPVEVDPWVGTAGVWMGNIISRSVCCLIYYWLRSKVLRIGRISYLQYRYFSPVEQINMLSADTDSNIFDLCFIAPKANTIIWTNRNKVAQIEEWQLIDRKLLPVSNTANGIVHGGRVWSGSQLVTDLPRKGKVIFVVTAARLSSVLFEPFMHGVTSRRLTMFGVDPATEALAFYAAYLKVKWVHHSSLNVSLK